MPMPFKAREISEKYGEPIEIWLPRLLAEHKTEVKVAAILGVYPNSVHNWRKKLSKQQGK